jgi:hypothetical protein
MQQLDNTAIANQNVHHFLVFCLILFLLNFSSVMEPFQKQGISTSTTWPNFALLLSRISSVTV